MNWHDFSLTALAFASETLGTLSGFGSSTFFVPLAVWFESLQMVLALTALLHVFGNLSKLALFRAHLPRRLLLQLALPSILLTGVGALMTRFVPVTGLKVVLGLVLVAVSLLRLFVGAKSPSWPRRFAIGLTAVSGFLTGLIGTGGAIRGLVLTSLQLDKATFVVLSALIDLGGDMLRAGIYIGQGYFDPTHWFYIPLLALAGWSGAWVGRRLLAQIPQAVFERVVLGFVLLSGLALIGEIILLPRPR